MRLTVKLTNYLFQTSQGESTWTNTAVNGISGVPTYEGRQVLSSSKTLYAFRDYMNSLSLSFSYDHAIGFLNKDLWRDESSQAADQRASVAGQAFLSQVCLSDKFSIVEDRGGFGSIGVAAHEIGHK